MKRAVFVFMTLAMLIFCGCAQRGDIFPKAEQSVPDISDVPSVIELTDRQREDIQQELFPYLLNGALLESWQSCPSVDDSFQGTDAAQDFLLLSAKESGDGEDCIEVELELYGNCYIDPAAQGYYFGGQYVVKAENADVQLLPDDASPHYPFVPFAKAVVTLKRQGGGYLPLKCDSESYDDPAFGYLKKRSEQLKQFTESSEKLDTAKYDPHLVYYLWRQLSGRRYIETPKDITLWDLENLIDSVELDLNSYKYGGQYLTEPLPSDTVFDGEIFKLMKNLEYFSTMIPLTDMSIFADIPSLRSLHIYIQQEQWGQQAEKLGKLRTGDLDILEISGFGSDLSLNLNGASVQTLILHSWISGITGFEGCEGVKGLSIISTRTDMRLVNADSFPAVSEILMDFYSESERVRDFSSLATFDDEVYISIKLDYRACNDKTLKSLEGVPVDMLMLDPYNGEYPLGEPDAEILAKIPAKNLIVKPAPSRV